jgi:hypothetical protein
MSYHILDYENEVNFDNIIIGPNIRFDNNSSRNYIYYIDNSPKEILLKMPFTRLIYNFQNLKFNQTKLPLYPMYDKLKKFLSFIKTLEKYIQSQIETDSIFCNSIEKYNSLKTIKININPDIKISSVLEGLKMSDLQQNGEVEFIIKICYIFNNNSRYGLKLSACQIKYTPPIEQLDIDFYSDTPGINIPNINNRKKESDKNILLDNNVKNINVPPPSLFNKIIPSVKDLQTMIKNLKKPQKDD